MEAPATLEGLLDYPLHVLDDLGRAEKDGVAKARPLQTEAQMGHTRLNARPYRWRRWRRCQLLARSLCATFGIMYFRWGRAGGLEVTCQFSCVHRLALWRA